MQSSEKKRVGFIGNMNNYPFMLARQMRDKGYFVNFLLIEDNELCRPEYRYSDINLPYPEWIIDLSPLNLEYFSGEEKGSKLERAIEILNGCDFIIVNGYAIRFSSLFKKKHICILTGSDLTVLADYKYAHRIYKNKFDNLFQNTKSNLFNKAVGLIEKQLIFNFFYRIFHRKQDSNIQWVLPRNKLHSLYLLLRFKIAIIKRINDQRNGIKTAFGFIHAPKGLIKDSDQLIEEIGVGEEKRIPGLMVDLGLSKYLAPVKKNKIRIFNVARFNWVKTKDLIHFSQLDYKGNDIMIKGLALFYRKHSTPLEIIFVNKGEDVAESKLLIRELEIEHLITWKEALTQKEVFDEYYQADIVFDQLDNSIISMGGLDAMGVGRPLIANARSEIFDSIFDQKTEICDSKSEEDVLFWLEKLVLDEEFRIEKGIASREFVLKHFSSNSVVDRIEKTLEKQNF